MKNIYIDRVMLYRQWLFLVGFMLLPFLLAAQSDPKSSTLRLKLTEQAAARIEKSSLNKSSKGYIVTGFPSMDALNEKSKIVSMKRVFAHAGKYEAKHRKYDLHLWYEISYPKSSTTSKSIESLRSAYAQLSEVQVAEVYLEKKRSYEEESMKPSKVNVLDTLADDPQLSLQWHYNNTGQTGGTPGADISLYQAWGLETGSSDVIVAVIDGGVDVDHQDLAGNMWNNPDEIPGNGIDDDNNGYVDDVYGYNFADGTGEIPGDSHGTHVGGTIAAETNNGIGVAGIAGGTGADDGVRLMSCTTFGVTTNGGFDEAFIYAADNGAVIAQNSWGYINPGDFEQSVLDAIDYFIAEAGYDENGDPYGPMQGGIVIFAAGNDGVDGEWYPGYYEPVLAVAGTDHNDNQYVGSNRGDWVEMAAPAVNVYSSFPNNQYGSATGTSMACPHVSGVAALIVSKFAGNITPEQVWSRLVETTDELPNLPPGFGTGRLNAFSALQEDDGTSPEAIDDLAVTDVYQNSITLTWTAPSDPGNGSASLYDIRYSTEPITEENFSSATQVGDEPTPGAAGTSEEFEVEGLNASSTFYFAIKSADFFGNLSELSNIATGTTENAPVISIVPDSLDIDIDVMRNPVATASITLSNEGDGANLEYAMSAAIVSQSQSFTSKLYPGDGLNRINMQQYGVGNSSEGVSPKAAGVSRTSEYQPYADAIDAIDSIAYDEPDNVAEDFVGLTSGAAFSSAVRFDVEQSVFTLTHVKNFFRTETLADPTTILEIYSGENLGSMELLLSQEVNLASEEGEYFTIPLEVPQTFYEGEVFWVVAKFPSGVSYPQGFDTDVTPRSNTFFYSADGGSSFSDLPYTLKVRALSASGFGVNWITFDPVTGTIAPGESEDVEITFDASTVGNGEYGVSIIAENNDPANANASIPASVTVFGQVPDLVTDVQFLEFGSVFVGNTEELPISIVNNGLGDLELTDISVEGFAFDVEPSSLSLAPGEEGTLLVTFSPAYAGNINGTLNITSNDPSLSSLEIPLVGVGTSPPIIGVTPEEVVTATLDAGDSTTQTIEITNYGNYPLTFSFPELAVERLLADPSIEKNNTSKIETIELTSKDQLDTRKGHPVLLGAGEDLDFGYRWIDSDEAGGPLFAWDDIASTGTEINESSDDGYTEIELPFPFEFYGEEKTSVLISSNGYLTFGTDGSDYTNDQIPGADDPDDFIAPFWDDLRPFSERGYMYYEVKPGRLIVQYEEVGNYASTGTATFQVVLYSNGSINFFYKSMSTLDDSESATVGIENADATDGLQVVFNNAYVKDSLAVSIMPPQPQFITDADPLGGVVPVNSSVSVEVTLNAADLYDGVYSNSLLVASNDPFNPEVEVPFELTVIGYPVIDVEPDSIEFDSLFIGNTQQASISVTNVGSKVLEVSSVTNSSSAFEVEFDAPVSIEPGRGISVPVTFAPESEGLFTDEVMISSDDSEGNGMWTVQLSGVGVIPPEIVVSPDSIAATVEAGEMAYDTITIENTGGYDLIYSLAGTYWFKTEVVQLAANAPVIDFGDLYLGKGDEDTRVGHPVRSSAGSDESFGYTWSDNKNGGPGYEWTDISTSGTDITAEIGSESFADGEVKVPIGFDFSFYGNSYDSVWVSANGLLSFSELGSTITNSQIPTANTTNNLIAGFWDDLEPGAISGTVVYESFDDMFIVQFTDVARYGSTSEGTVTFQMIVYENGDIKLQYADVESANFLDQSTIGIENATGTDGAQVAFNTEYLEDELVMLFEPPVMGKVAPGEMVTVAVTLDASDLNDGVYEDDVIISSNDPETPEVYIPVTLTVQGMPEIVALPDTLDFEEVYVHEDSVFSKTLDVTVSNPGSKVLTVDSLFIDGSGFMLEDGSPFTLDPDDELTLSVTFMPDSLIEYSASLVFYSDSESDSTYTVTLLGEGVAPPVFTAYVPGDSIYVELKSDEVASEFVTVANSGGSLLTYDATVQYSLGASASSFAEVPEYAHITASEAPMGMANAEPVISVKKMSDDGINFSDSIAYDPGSTADDFVGIPDTTIPFASATKFEAPSSGFTLTHVRNFFRTEGSTDPVVMEVYAGGDSPVFGELVASQEITGGTTDGEFALITLDAPQSFDEGEVFWVVFHYPVSMVFSQGINEGVAGVEGLYMYSNNGGVSYNPAEVDIPGAAFKVRALMSVSPWITLAPEAGELAPAEEEQIEVTMSAAEAGPGDHYASVMISSNDPFNPMVQIPVQVHVNQLPEFTEYPADTISVYESGEISVTLKAEDYDGEVLVYTLEEMYLNATFTAAEDSAVVKFAPDFEQSGYYTFTVAAMDNSLETATVSFVVEVIDVNRPPMIVDQIPVQRYNVGGGTDVIDLSAYITDPDMEPLTYTVTAINAEIVDVEVEGKLLFITPLKRGTTYVSVIASDEDEAMVGSSFEVRVRRANANPVVVKQTEDQDMSTELESVVFNLSEMFEDPDGDILSYSALSSNEDVVTVVIAEDMLILVKHNSGESQITVDALDGKGGVASTSFLTKVGRVTGVEGAFSGHEIGLTSYPNPMNATSTLRYSLTESSDVNVQILTTDGRMIRTIVNEKQMAGDHDVMHDRKGLREGLYLYRIQVGDQVFYRRLAVSNQ
ncbi:choice-of-anchor D domain-containing protein [Fulvivirga maritima]|uniref:Ig-like domain-containing protein n=1 Tax=Fulvivirga maritima TaxID=2904247 RepID=UPI001F214A09|nr:choice-of-anchor D domain-containing protein [Fulvivirga maritima]UII26306.1 choice-of-anchor D domain-containing protein [Fulvivirga maritima]